MQQEYCCFVPVINQWHQNINQQYLFHLNVSISYCKDKKNALWCLQCDSGSALCHPFVQGGILINSSNSFTWISQHFHYKKRGKIQFSEATSQLHYKHWFRKKWDKTKNIQWNTQYSPLSSGHEKRQDQDGSCKQCHYYPFPWKSDRILYFCIFGAHLNSLSSQVSEPEHLNWWQQRHFQQDLGTCLQH